MHLITGLKFLRRKYVYSRLTRFKDSGNKSFHLLRSTTHNKLNTQVRFKETSYNLIGLLYFVALFSTSGTALAFAEEQNENNEHEENMNDIHILGITPNFEACPSLKAQRDSSICGSAQYSANDPIEDRLTIEKLQNGGWWFAVFDGHGGWQCSDFVHQALHRNFEEELNNHLGYFPKSEHFISGGVSNHRSDTAYTGKISSRVIVRALKSAFKRTDRQYMSKVSGAFEIGFGRDTRAGSCALAVFVIDGVLFCANAGDCRAVVVSSKNVSSAERNTLKNFAKNMKKAKEEVVESKISIVQPVDDLGTNIKIVQQVREELGQIALRKSLGLKCDPEEEKLLRKRLIQTLKDGNELGCEVIETTSFPETRQSSLVTRFLSFMFSKATTDGLGDTNSEALVPDISLLDLSEYVEAINVSNDHNAKIKSEQEKLRKKHPNENDIVLCKNANSCYVKGRLQPTRAFGDFHLKYSEFTFQNSKTSLHRQSVPFTPPYITCVPEIIVRPITREKSKRDEILVLASDGLWDMLPSQSVGEKLLRWIKIDGLSPKQAAERLVEEALSESAKKHGVTLEELKAIRQGRQRRRKHDDITVVVVDLTQLMDFFYFG